MFSTLLSSLPTICLAVLVLRVLKLIAQVCRARLSLRQVPGPPSSSLIWGEEWNLYSSSPGTPYADWHNHYGKVLKFNGALGHQVISVTDARAISFILGEGTYSFPKHHGVRAWFAATLGQGILWVEGKEAHERQRRVLAPALSPQSVRRLTHIFHETSGKLVQQWSRIIENFHKEQVEIEVTDWAARFAIDTVARAAFNHDFDCLSGNAHSLAEALDGLTNSEHDAASFYMRALFWIFPSILSIGEKGKMIKLSKKELGDAASRMWREAKDVGDAESKTLMGLMLQAEKAEGQQSNEEEVIAQMRTVISAGYETVSAIVAWTLYELANNARLQRELREELLTAGDSSLDELNNKYPLLDAVIKETLRLHPPILENHHEAAETIAVPLSEPILGTTSNQLVIPKGTLIAIPLNVVQTDSTTWGSDAHFFRPDRWIERKSSGIRHNRELLAFGEGPRSCIGKTFATTEIKALVSALIRNFSFSSPHEIEPFQSFVIRPRVKGEARSSLPLLVRRL